MRIKKRTLVKIISFFICAVFVLSGFVGKFAYKSNQYKDSIRYSYLNALFNISEYINKINTALNQVKYSVTDSFMIITLNEIWRYSGSASESLAFLPYDNENTLTIAKFVSQAGDYSYSISKKLTNGGELSEEDKKNLAELSNLSETLNLHFSNLQKDINENKVNADTIEVLKQKSSSDVPTLTDSITKISEDLSGGPSLIYDGPFSEHIETAKSVFLTDKSQKPINEILSIASKFSGEQVSNFSTPSENKNIIESYWITSKTMSIEITKAGGYVKNFLADYTTNEKKLSFEDAVIKAKTFLNKQGFTDMRESYYYQDNNILTVNFAYVKDDVIFYPDLIKVGVSLSDGKIVSFESSGYLMNHNENRKIEPKIKKSEAKTNINKSLTVKEENIAIIPTTGKQEVLCYEFLCEAEDGTEILVYINAETGNEQNILILLKSDNGTLTIGN